MRGINKVILVGTLGRDPESKTFSNGGTVCNFSIATSEQWTDKASGERREATEWHRIVANGRLAEICQQYLKKGSQVYIEGSIRTREWEQDGQKRQTTEIRANELQMLGGKPAGAGQSSAPAPQPRHADGSPRSTPAPAQAMPEDDLPF